MDDIGAINSGRMSAREHEMLAPHKIPRLIEFCDISPHGTRTGAGHVDSACAINGAAGTQYGCVNIIDVMIGGIMVYAGTVADEGTTGSIDNGSKHIRP